MKKNFYTLLSLLCCFSCDDIIEVTDISKEELKVLAPSDQSILTDAAVAFTWETMEEAERYHLQIATPNFQQAAQIVADTLVTKTTFAKALQSGNYQWRIRAENSGYSTAYAIQSFQVMTDVEDISEKKVTITAPEDNATFQTMDTITFTWNPVEGADNYAVQIVTPDFDNITATITDTVITETTISVDNLNAGDYKIRIQAKNTLYETAYTEIGFTVNE